jgi:branched-chain amino acid aminotransferase
MPDVEPRRGIVRRDDHKALVRDRLPIRFVDRLPLERIGENDRSPSARIEAAAHGCDQVVWLDAIERRYIEEMGGMNLFFVFGSGGSARLVTPELSGSLLPGITRDSLLQLAGDAGFAVEERKIDVEEWRKGVAAGEITEVFACGTAAVITPVSHVKYGDGDFTVGDGTPGEVTMALRDTLTGIQRGTFADTHGWMTRLR